MKTKMMSKLMILSGFCVLSACSGKGGDKNNSANAVGPQGRIMSLSSQYTYCDISPGAINCTSMNQETGQVCKTQQKLYNAQDMGNFCQKMHELKYESSLGYGACDATSAIDRILNENCKGIATPGMPNNPNPGYPNPNPGYPNPNPGYPNPSPGFPGGPRPLPPVGFVNCDIQINDQAPVRFPLMAGNIVSTAEYKLKPGGLFGMFKKSIYKVFLKYTPKNHKWDESIDIKITHNDKRRNVKIEHSGYAGQPVLLSAVDNKDVITVNCVDARHPARNGAPVTVEAAPQQKNNLVCRGYSDTLTGGREEIDVNRPLNSIIDGEELAISSAVRVLVDKTKSGITYKSVLDDTFGPDLSASSSLRIPAILRANEGLSKASVECSLK